MTTRYPHRKGQQAVRLADEDRALLLALAEHEGVGKGDIVTMALRAFAKERGVKAEQRHFIARTYD
jgi:hypothetical protein